VLVAGNHDKQPDADTITTTRTTTRTTDDPKRSKPGEQPHTVKATQEDALPNIATIALYGVLAFRCEIVLPAHKNAVTGLYCAVTAYCGQMLKP